MRDSGSLFCWHVVRTEDYHDHESCELCEYRRKWLDHEFSLVEFTEHNERRHSCRSGKKILVVDDDPNNLYALEEAVRTAGHDCISACNGEEALFIVRELLPDLIISDVLMPKIDGYAVCRHVKSDNRTGHIPVMLITALGMRKDIIKGYSSGADQYMVKPFKARKLANEIEALLNPGETRLQRRKSIMEKRVGRHRVP